MYHRLNIILLNIALFVSFQITTLINHKDKLKKTEKTLRAIQRVGQAVSVAVGRFVAVGEAIAAENEDLKDWDGTGLLWGPESRLVWHYSTGRAMTHKQF